MHHAPCATNGNSLMIFTGGAYRELQREVREAKETALTALTEGRSHQGHCIVQGQRIEEMLREGRSINEARHAENQEAINSLKSQVMWTFISALATIVLAVVGFVVSIFAHKLGLT